MRPRILLTVLLTALFVILSGCGTTSNCPVCGTTTNGAYAVIDVVPVPEHNNTGEPGGPFNSFDISWVSTPPSGGASGIDNLDYVSDRIGIAVQVIDTNTNLAVYSIAGQNGISGGGDNASPCVSISANPIPPIVSVLGNWTRFGCRTGAFHIPGFGASGNFGGFTGAQCCAARANGINPLSGPNGMVVTADGNTLFVGNGSSSFVVFDLTSMKLQGSATAQPDVIAVIPTGLSPDYDGQLGNSAPWPGAPAGTLGNTTGIAGCAESANGRAFSDPSCGDLRGDEMAYDSKDHILGIIDGDPGLPYITFIDVSGLVTRPVTNNCLPVLPTTPYGPPLGNPLGLVNPSSCILGQIYYDGAPQNNTGVPVDDVGLNAPSAFGFVCPDPSNPQVQSGVSGNPVGNPVVNITGTTPIPCHHGPIIDNATGIYDPTCNPTVSGAACIGAISPAGLGAPAWNPSTDHFLLPNSNSTGVLNVGSIDEIDPRPGNPNGPVVINSFPTPNCMPTSIVQGPGDNFLVGCADHDGEAFPANEYVMNGTTGAIVATITNVGGVDEVWYNPGDNKYYLAARDMLPGPVMGVIDAGTNLWLANLPVNTNAHSIAVDPKTNHVFMPQQAGAICGTQAGAGCIDVIAEQ
ncbi:MAG: hypothetical protein ABR880_10600 [Candidatus Sulfotelmatobacter sp.]|jgi:hypothetical protein